MAKKKPHAGSGHHTPAAAAMAIPLPKPKAPTGEVAGAATRPKPNTATASTSPTPMTATSALSRSIPRVGTASVGKALCRRLEALNYPLWERFDHTDMEQVQTVVAWVENQKIREYTESGRVGLCGVGGSIGQWSVHLSKYLEDLSLSHSLDDFVSPENMPKVLLRLLNFAVGVEFRDDAAGCNRTAHRSMHHSGGRDDDDVSDPSIQAAIAVVGATLQVPLSAPQETLAAARAVVSTHLQLPVGGKERPVQTFDPKVFPLGFTTQDEQLDRAAAVLRLLYINDLRHLQTQVNDIVATLQGYTANPKTDNKLGKVGR